MELTKAITADSQIKPGRLYTKKRTSKTQVSAVARNLVAIAGECLRGPTTGVVVGNEKRFLDVFGGRSALNKVRLTLLEKDLFPCVIFRAHAAAAVKAAKNLQDGAPATIATATATSPGTWANAITYDIANATDGNVNHWNATFYYDGRKWVYENLDTTTGNDNLLAKVGDDEANPVVLAKVADGRPVNVVGATLNTTAGADGAIADTDFTAAGKALELAAAYPNAVCVLVAERSNANIKAKLNTLAGASSDRDFLMCPDADTTSVASAKTDVATYRSERVRYCFNHVKVVDPETGTKVTVDPLGWRATLYSQTDADIHAGDPDNVELLSGVRDVVNASLTDTELDELTEAGISTLVKYKGFRWFADVTSSLTGEKSGPTVRIADFLVRSAADFLEGFVNKTMTAERKTSMKSALDDFSDRMWRSGRYIDADPDDVTRGGYEVDITSVNNATDEGNGIFRILWRVRVLGHFLSIVLEHEMNRTLKFRRLAA